MNLVRYSTGVQIAHMDGEKDKVEVVISKPTMAELKSATYRIRIRIQSISTPIAVNVRR